MNNVILFLIFNRLENKMRVFEPIWQAKPDHIYIAADGSYAK